MFQDILVPIDVEQESSWRSVLPLAAKLTIENKATLHVVAVIPPFGSTFVGGFFAKDFEEEVVSKVKARLVEIVSDAALSGVTPKLHVTRGTIYEEILKTADQLDADLIVLAAQRPELRDFLLGPNAARVVRHATQSVFIVRS